MINTALIKEIFLMAMDSIRLNKLRSFLTILGIVIGILTIVAMVAVIEGLNAGFSQQLESMGSNILFVSRFDPGIRFGRPSEEMRKRKKLMFEDAQEIERRCPSILAASPDASYFRFLPPVRVKYRANEIENPQIIGVNQKFMQIYETYAIESGRFFTEAENLNKREVCVIGADVTDALFSGVSALDKTIIIDSKKLRVIGTLTKQGKFLGQSRDNFLVVPVETFRKLYPGFDDISILVKVRSTVNLEQAKDEIINLMRIRRKVKVNEKNNFSVFSQETLSDLYNQLTGAAYLVMMVISSIALVVGGIGVMNIMLVSVKERTREIGIRKALGARRNAIRRQFLYEAMILTMSGGVIGLLLGILVSFIIRWTTGLPASVNVMSILVGLFTSTSVGLFFGIYPASKAAKLDPVEALRYE